MIFSYIVLVLFCGYADALRGGQFGKDRWPYHSTIIVQIAYGWAAAAILGFGLHWSALACALLFYAGQQPGWGYGLFRIYTGHDVNRKDPTWWEYGPLKENEYLHAGARGFIWGVPVFLLIPVSPLYALPAIAMAVALPVAAVIAAKFRNHNFANVPGIWDGWGVMEVIRGMLFGALLVLLSQGGG